MALAENEAAALFLMKEVFPQVPYQCVVAGRQPQPVLYEAARLCTNVEIIPNPSPEEMDELMKNAHIHLLHTAQPTGLKLKLLNVLYQGRHIVANSQMLAGTDLPQTDLCQVVDTAKEQIEACKQLKNRDFTEEQIATRIAFLQTHYDRNYLVQEMLSDL